MLDDSLTDFRHLIEEKLRVKKSALDQTEQHLRKFSVLRDANRTPSAREHVSQSKPSIRGRLGPKASLEARLGKLWSISGLESGFLNVKKLHSIFYVKLRDDN